MKCSQPNIKAQETYYLLDALANNDIGVGKYIEKFEQEWANYNTCLFGVSCNSGTNAMYLALKALGIGYGDEVIVPEFTMIATAWAVTYTGATPVFVDCKDDLTIDVSKINITERTKAIMPVHIYGRRCDMEAINKLGVYVVEDMAESHGIKPTGDIACYSFYGNKIITTGEGGMCLTNNKEWADEMRLLANMYFDKNRSMLHPKVGHNFRMTNLQASIGYGQAERIDEILAKRKQIERWYNQYLPKEVLMPNREVVWMYDIDCGDKQEEVKNALLSHNIESRYYFKPMSQQPMYKGNFEALNAYRWSNRGLYLPTYPDMTEEDVKQVSKIIYDTISK